MNLHQLENQLSREFGGPTIGAAPRIPGERFRPHMGGGGGDNGAAQKMEDDRQARISAATATINSIFGGQKSKVGVNKASSYQPGTKYYNVDGTEAEIPMMTIAGDNNGQQAIAEQPYMAYGGDNYYRPQSTAQPVDRQVENTDLINQMVADGRLFTGTQDVSAPDDREKMYSDQSDAVRQLNQKEVDRQYADTSRANKFALARASLLGGSSDVDSNAELQRRANEGTMRAAGLGDQAAADLRTQDESTRGNLISMAQSGIDTGTAEQMALKGLEANNASAAGARGGATIGNLFNDLSQAYLVNQTGIGTKAGTTPSQTTQWYGVSSPQQRYSGS